MAPIARRQLAGLILVALAALSLRTALAGGNGADRGGGLVFECEDGHVYLADTFTMTYRNRLVFNRSRESVLAHFFNDLWRHWDRIFKPTPGVIEAIGPAELRVPDDRQQTLVTASRLKSLMAELSIETVETLPLLADSNYEGAPRGCHAKQLAVQTISAGRVQLVRSLFDRLTPFEQAYFMLHEGLVRSGRFVGDTKPIRNFLNNRFLYLLWSDRAAEVELALKAGQDTERLTQSVVEWLKISAWAHYKDQAYEDERLAYADFLRSQPQDLIEDPGAFALGVLELVKGAPGIDLAKFVSRLRTASSIEEAIVRSVR